MISTKALAAAAAVMVLACGGVALAKDKDSKKPAKPVVHTAESIQCSKEATEKGLKGKERKKFRAHCIRELKKHPEKKS
jgi:hypothetical protein